MTEGMTTEHVLLLSCSTGQGHNSCAQAIKEYFEKQNVHCEIQDSMTFLSKGFARFMSWGHSFMYRHIPSLFRWGYRYSQTHPGVFRQNSGIYKILTMGAERLNDFMVSRKFDTVICTHVFSAMILTHSLKQRPLAIKTAFVATDYTFYPGMDACNLQKYFIASKQLIDTYSRLGISRDCIIASGIPVQQKFWGQIGKVEAKRFLKVNERSKHLVMMCGSMGCGPMEKMLKHIAKKLPENVEVSVICGTNQWLFRKLNHRYRRYPKIHIIAYTDQMPLYIDSADLCLTKPGGISVTEAALKNVPMAFVNAVAGCEQYNMDFFTGLGGAVTDDSPIKLAEKSIRLLLSDQELMQMKLALQEYRQPNGAECIFYEMNSGAGICRNRVL